LFGKLGLPTYGKTKTQGYSTDASVLEKLAPDHEIVRQLLSYRQLFKLKSTYIDALPKLIHPKTGRLHTSLNQTIAATGRLSSSEPNLQNIPVRSDEGRLIRQAFVPEDGDNAVILSADYSQIELRLLAHYSQDPHLVQAFCDGQDIHQATAALVFGVPLAEVTKNQRYQAKTVNFGVIYGQSAFGLAQQLGIPNGEAQTFITQYFLRYPQVKGFIDGTVAQAHDQGFVTTLCGRRRDLRQDLASRQKHIREFAERAAFNTVLQGSAADLIKVAMVRLQHALEVQKLKTRLILQVHDEVVLEVPKSEIDTVTALVQDALTLDQPLRVPLVVDTSIGNSWMEA
jgi:DNA polymerase-1